MSASTVASSLSDPKIVLAKRAAQDLESWPTETRHEVAKALEHVELSNAPSVVAGNAIYYLIPVAVGLLALLRPLDQQEAERAQLADDDRPVVLVADFLQEAVPSQLP